MSFAGQAAYATFDFTSDYGRYIIDNFEGTFGSSELPFVKILLEGPEEIGIKLPNATQYVFEISYTNPDQETPVLILDTVPAEFEIISLSTDVGNAIYYKAGKGKSGAYKIEWDLSAEETSGTLTVYIQTVESPGKGHKEVTFKPTSCGLLTINDGAVAYEIDPDTGKIVEVLMGPTNSLGVEAVEGSEPCEVDPYYEANLFKIEHNHFYQDIYASAMKWLNNFLKTG